MPGWGLAPVFKIVLIVAVNQLLAAPRAHTVRRNCSQRRDRKRSWECLAESEIMEHAAESRHHVMAADAKIAQKAFSIFGTHSSAALMRSMRGSQPLLQPSPRNVWNGFHSPLRW
uniref:Putative secreted protein n=1 Tax=Anopheles darlingi TaxID=43151 RepID=A0A2M4DJ15_ANODA